MSVQAEGEEVEGHPGFVWESWTYAGQRSYSGGKCYHVWYNEDWTEPMPYGKLKGTSVGAVYLVPVERGKGTVNVIPGLAHYVKRYTGPEVPGWELAHRSVIAAKALASKQRKEGTQDVLGNLTLAQARASVTKQFGPNRTATLAAIMAYLTN